MRAAIITIGDELLNGQTIDTNSAWLGQELNQIGFNVTCKLAVKDERSSIINGLEFGFSQADVILVTGGLGPTKDDITKKVLAEYFQDELVFHSPTFDRINDYFKQSNRTPTEAHRLQSFMPSRATILINDRGTAPGMWFQNEQKILLSMPGVPSEMKGIMINEGLDRIAELNSVQHIRHFFIQTAGIGETYLAERIDDIITAFPKELSLAYLPGIASVKLRLTAVGEDYKNLENLCSRFGNRIKERIGSHVYGVGAQKLEEVIGKIALQRELMIGTAESCTGGLIAQMITSISGSSAYFKGSVVAYANEVKIKTLNVSKDTLADHGAVSKPVVEEMVTGLLTCLEVDIAVSVSGIAGPSGGTPQKPVGTIWIAVGNKSKIVTKKLQLSKTRKLNIKYTAICALNQLRLFIENEYS